MADESTKTWRHVKVTEDGLTFKKKLVTSKWVKFSRDFEDGLHKYQKGQRIEIKDRVRLMTYLEAEIVEPCDPVPASKPERSGKTALYRMLDSVVSERANYGSGKQYELPVELGDKWADRDLCVKIRDLSDADKPENAMRKSSRG